MKKLILTLTAVLGLAASAFAADCCESECCKKKNQDTGVVSCCGDKCGDDKPAPAPAPELS